MKLVEAYAKAQGLFREAGTEALYDETIELDLGLVEPSLAGPKRPQDRVSLTKAKTGFQTLLPSMMSEKKAKPASAGASASAVAVLERPAVRLKPDTTSESAIAEGLDHGAVVVAAITSCTNTSNPSVMIGAGLLAKKAVERGLTRRPWVKTSLAPGSKVVTDYLDKAGLTPYLDMLGFNLVGYGCTTCIGNSGPLPDEVSAIVAEKNLVVCSVLSGNRNFEGRIQSQVRANYLASPPLVVAYALAGRMTLDLTTEPIGKDRDGKDVYLREIWPTEREIQAAMLSAVKSEMFQRQYANVFEGDERWRSLPVPTGNLFEWDEQSTYVRKPPFVEGISREPAPLTDIISARVLAVLGDSVTTDHISPAGSIPADSPAGKYLIAQGVKPSDFNWYGARRGNHEVMMRGTFANIRLRNQLAPGTEGGWTTYQPAGGLMTIYDASIVVSGRRRAAARAGRQGIRIGLVARLGGEGHAAAGRARGHRRELRAHSSQQPRQHGRAAAPVRARRVSRLPGPDGRRVVRHRDCRPDAARDHHRSRAAGRRRSRATFRPSCASTRRKSSRLSATAAFFPTSCDN